MRVLVTGGAGFIGSQTAKKLNEQGFEIVVFDNFSTGHRSACKWGDLVEGDIRDRDNLVFALKRHKIEAVIHFAAVAYVGESMAEPGKYYSNNVVGSLNLLESCVSCGVNKLVFSSSCATYGVPTNLPIDENTLQNPINPYGETKLAVEKALFWYSQAADLNYVALRYFNAAGSDKDGEIGENHEPETHLIPLVLDAAAGRRGNITVFGSDYDTRDGTAERDYIHVEDLAVAHVKALEALVAGKGSFCCNLGTGVGQTVKEVIDTVAEVAGRSVPVVFGPRRQGDPPSLVASSSLAQDLLSWSPQNNFRQIIEDAYRWRSKLFSGATC